MTDIRKRTGPKGVTYQVRYPTKGAKSGYAYKTFLTMREARDFSGDATARKRGSVRGSEIKTVEQAVDKWMEICEKEGRDGREPVTNHTRKGYQYRADLMKAYPWPKALQELEAPDVVEFRSWLLKNHGRDQARRALSSFHSVMKEMTARGYVASNVSSGITIRADSRYNQPVVIPTPQEVWNLLAAADRLANSKNRQTARTWERYRPMMYLAADSGMRPQEYIALPGYNVLDTGVKVDRAIEGGGYKISVTKTPAGRRFIDLSPDTLAMVTHYRDKKAVKNDHDLVFPTGTGHWQSIDTWRRRCFGAACQEAGLMEKVEEDGETTERPKFTPYDLRHFFASVLIAKRVNLKRIQKLMGHQNIKITLDVYGHLIEAAELGGEENTGMLVSISPKTCGESVAIS